jgi:hypothetical protein
MSLMATIFIVAPNVIPSKDDISILIIGGTFM